MMIFNIKIEVGFFIQKNNLPLYSYYLIIIFNAKKLVYRYPQSNDLQMARSKFDISNVVPSTESIDSNLEILPILPIGTNRDSSDIGTFEDAFGNEILLPRDTDRILEQFVLMLLRVSMYLKTEGGDAYKMYECVQAPPIISHPNYMECSTVLSNDADEDTPPNVGSTKEATASYITDYPQIFNKKQNDAIQICCDKKNENDAKTSTVYASYRSIQSSPDKEITIEIEKTVSYRKFESKKRNDKTSDKKASQNVQKGQAETNDEKSNHENKASSSGLNNYKLLQNNPKDKTK